MPPDERPPLRRWRITYEWRGPRAKRDQQELVWGATAGEAEQRGTRSCFATYWWVKSVVELPAKVAYFVQLIYPDDDTGELIRSTGHRCRPVAKRLALDWPHASRAWRVAGERRLVLAEYRFDKTTGRVTIHTPQKGYPNGKAATAHTR